ncbi:MAG: hypothetical protein H6826_13735 [Planctomycetes bacterium]|nr:hypothetical protein [Planctomycetota bacterium]
MSNIMQQLARDASFRELYEIARAQQAEVYFDEMIEIADDARNDWMEANGADDAGWRANKENVQRSRLRIDTRKWMLSKMLPKKYGDLAAGTAPNEHAEELRKLRQLMLTGRSDVDAPENP